MGAFEGSHYVASVLRDQWHIRNWFTLHQSNFTIGLGGMLLAFSMHRPFVRAFGDKPSHRRIYRTSLMTISFLVNVLLEYNARLHTFDFPDIISGSLAVFLFPLAEGSVEKASKWIVGLKDRQGRFRVLPSIGSQ
jgi:hypothetical protein